MVSQMMSADSNPLMIIIEAHKLDISDKEKESHCKPLSVHVVAASALRGEALKPPSLGRGHGS